MKDALRFVLAFRDPIEQSAPHIYISALPFAPKQSKIAQAFLHNYQRTITVTTGKPDYWPSTLFASNYGQTLVDLLVFSRDQRYFASCGDTICICDAENGNLVSGPFTGSEICSATFSPDGHRLVASSPFDKTVRIWDVMSGDELLCLPSEDRVIRVVYSNNGQWIATCSQDTTIRVWDAESGKAICTPLNRGKIPSTDTPPVTMFTVDARPAIVFSTDDQRIILGLCTGNVEIWDIYGGKRDKLFQLGSNLLVVALSLDGQFMVGRSPDGTAHMWDIKAEEPPFNVASLDLLEGRTNTHGLLAYSANGKRLASVSQENRVRVWDLPGGQIVFGPLSVHSLNVCTAVLSADGKKLALGSTDGTVRMWDLTDRASSLLVSTGTSDLQSQLNRVSDLQEKREMSLSNIPKYVFGVTFSPCGKKLLSQSRDGIRTWDVDTGERLVEPLFDKNSGDIVTTIVFSPDGEWFASLSGLSGSICIWGTTGNLIRQSPAMDLPWEQLALLPNGRNLVSCKISRVWIWDVATMDNPVKYQLRDFYPSTTVLSPNGTKVVWLNGAREQLLMWSPETRQSVPVHFQNLLSSPSGEPIVIHFRGLQSPKRMVFSQSGNLVCPLLSDFQVCDVETGKEVASGSFNGHPSTLAFSPDDRFIVASIGHWFQGFDITHRRICGTWSGHTGSVTDIKFSSDGKKVVSCSDNGTIRIWNISDFMESSPNRSFKESNNSYMDGCTLANGWVKTANGELLFWVPPWNRDGLWWPRSTAVIAETLTKLDLTKFEYGDDWQKCRDNR